MILGEQNPWHDLPRRIKTYLSNLPVALVILMICPLQPASAGNFDMAQATLNSSASVTKPESDEAEPDKWGKFLPLPIFVTEPAIGEGLGATLIYFHRDEGNDKPGLSTPNQISKTGQHSKPPPIATGIFAFYTNNDTTAVGAGHSNTFANDRFRLRAAAAEARINSNFYIGDLPIGFQLEGSILFADLKMRLGNSSTFFGISTSYSNAHNKYRTDESEVGDSDLTDFDFVDAGVAASLIYDTRDNTILPSEGHLLEIFGWQYGKAVGGDFDYSSTRLKGLWFKRFNENYVLGVRADASKVSGDAPFFAEPYVSLRGIPALRYQGDQASALELEFRRRFADRWTISLFGGVGAVKIGTEKVETDHDIRTIGIGTRYLALRDENAWVGIDIASGPEDVAWYIQIGSPW